MLEGSGEDGNSDICGDDGGEVLISEATSCRRSRWYLEGGTGDDNDNGGDGHSGVDGDASMVEACRVASGCKSGNGEVV